MHDSSGNMERYSRKEAYEPCIILYGVYTICTMGIPGARFYIYNCICIHNHKWCIAFSLQGRTSYSINSATRGRKVARNHRRIKTLCNRLIVPPCHLIIHLDKLEKRMLCICTGVLLLTPFYPQDSVQYNTSGRYATGYPTILV